MRSINMRILVLLFTLLSLVSCGGGGSGGDTPPGSGLADVVVTTFSAPSSGVAGTSITVTGSIRNQGGMTGVASAVIFLSPTSNVTVDGGQLGFDFYMGFLDPGQSWNFSFQVSLPANIANGTYYLNAVAEGDDPSVAGNNVWHSPVTFTVTGGTVCSDDAYEADNSAGTAKTILLGESQQHNHCNATSDYMSFTAAAGTAYSIIGQKIGNMTSLSLSVYDTDGSTRLAGVSSPWATYSRMTWTAPADGTYYLKVAPYSGVQSSGANTEYLITLGNALNPDFVVDNFWYQGAGLPGGIINVSDNVRNVGFADAGQFDVSVYISTDPTVTAADTPIGTRTVTSLAANQSDAGSWLECSLPMLPDGTYYLATIANPGGTNEIATSNNTSTVLPITITAPTGCEIDLYEPDNTYGTTTNTIQVGDAPQAHNFCTDGSDWIEFTAEAGKDYSVRVVQTSGYGSPCAQLYDTNGTTLLAGDCSNSPRAIDWHADASGTYYIEVSGSTGEANEYTVQLQEQLPDLTQTLTINWPTVNAGGLLDVTDAVANPGYAAAGPFAIGVYRSIDDIVTMEDAQAASRSLTGLAPQTSIWDTNQASYSVLFPKGLLPGTYYLAAIADTADAVTELSEANNTSQAIQVTVTTPSCAWDLYEDDDDPASAWPILAEEIQSRNFCDDNIDWVSFIPSADGAYVADTGAYYLELYQADGTTRITPHDTDMSSRLSWIATGGTTYYLKNYTGYSAYQFTVFACAQDAYEDDDSSAAAKTIATGQQQTRNQCEDGEDWAKFDAMQNTTYTIKATNGVNLSLELYNTDGWSHLAWGSMGSGQTKGMSVITWTAPSTGTYFIRVSPVWGFGKGHDYTLSLD